MTGEEFIKLLGDVKAYLDITWTDEATENKLTGIVKRGVVYLQDKAGNASLNFFDETQARSLLFDYCRYARSNALEVFTQNFKSELISLRLENLIALQEAEASEN